MMRTLGVPARYVQGYLPGKELGDSAGTRQIDGSASHAWVEVYFPNYGWVKFDPTPGNTANGRAPTVLPIGDPVPPGQGTGPSPTPGGFVPGFQIPEEPVDPATVPQLTPKPPDPGLIGLMVVTTLIVVAVVLALFARRRRRPALSGDQTFDRVARLASRFGYAPHPSQTAYEYAGTLSDVLPGIRQELQVVAHAKVESTYARRLPSASAVEAMRNAYARIRRGMMRLVLRRGRGRRGTRAAGSRTR
jgi:hypothetical protein